jgi:amidophosphoribosyltransferase
MCGIFGIYLFNECSDAYMYILNGITLLQHRGQDAAGIYTCKNSKIFKYKEVGRVDEVFKKDQSNHLVGNMGIGHIRYSTTGNLSLEQAQPLYTNIPYGITIVHNGNLTNTEDILCILRENRIHINSDSDSDILLNYFAFLFNYFLKKDLEINNAIFKTVENIMNVCKGSYSVILMINGFGLVIFRDPHGIRPLCFGKNEELGYAFSSESVALDCTNYNLVRDVEAGECLIINKNGFYSEIIQSSNLMPCLFEYIYFSRPESVINKILVYQARKNMGEQLANKIIKMYPGLLSEIDVVMPVPDSGRISSLRASYVLNKPYCEGLIKNNYIGRTFIMPNQKQRKKNLKIKLNTINQEFKDKIILLIDDSIVRGNTSIEIIKLVRNAGAKKLIFASIAPPVKYPNFYGIAIPTSEELIAYNKTNDEICSLIGADCLIYNDLEDIEMACKYCNPEIIKFESSCFDSNYIY